MTAADVLVRDVVTVKADDSVADAIKLLVALAEQVPGVKTVSDETFPAY